MRKPMEVFLRCAILCAVGCGSTTEPGAADAGADSSTPTLPADASAPKDGASPVDASPLPPCAPSSASATHFVDPMLGTDDASHGGGAGDCAVKTLAYALRVATANIVLAQATYQVDTAILLTGQQRLECDEKARATLRGQPDLSTTALIVRSSGSDNRIKNCILEGEDKNGYCIDHVGNSVSKLALEGVSLSKCGGAGVRLGLGNLTLTNSAISTGGVPVALQESGSATIVGNTFESGTGADVSCSRTGWSISGRDNKGRGGAAATCDAECNCPVGF